MIVLNENNNINLSRFVEESTDEYLDFLEKKGIMKVGKDSNALNAFYIRYNDRRATGFATSFKIKDFEGKPMEGFKDLNRKPISEKQFKDETIDAIVSRFNIPKNIATNIVVDYLERINEKIS